MPIRLRLMPAFLVLALAGGIAVPSGPARAAAPCRIEVLEAGSGWPVPLVELRTTHQLRFVTDNAGVIALDAPELLGREAWFNVIGHGYEVATDGFGYRGVRLTPQPGATLRVEVRRTALARRLGRLTGAGQFAESQQLGGDLDWTESGVFGCDSVLLAEHRGRLHWAWGDTTLPGYPLGLFDTSGATTGLRPLASLGPPLRLRFEHFRDAQGRVRAIAKLPGDGPTWLSALTSLPDKDGTPRLVATYRKITPPLETREAGLCVWNDTTQNFERHRVVWTRSAEAPEPPPFPDGHPARWRDDADREWVLFGNPFPTLRCRATFEAWQDPAQWEVLAAPSSLAAAADGAPVKPHTGSLAWHAWRGRWVTVFMEAFGQPSTFGELWYAEADAPTGPWGRAVKVLSHDHYTFYNPRVHPELAPTNSPVLLFEGTFTRQFTTPPAAPVPRHDYNQVLYRLDLDDPRLRPAQDR